MSETDNNSETHGANEVAPKALKRGVDARRAVERPHEV